MSGQEFTLLRGSEPRERADLSLLDRATTRVNSFTRRFYEVLAETPGNLVASPTSIALALAMTATGARGRTAREFKQLFELAHDDSLSALFNALEAALRKDGQDTPLGLANALFSQASQPIEKAFLARLARDFGAGVHAVDFAAAPRQARALINAWVAERTRDRISELLGPRDIDALTRLVLVNAVLFDAKWRSPFMPSNTRTGSFTLEDGTSTDVSFMNGVIRAPHGRFSDFEALALPYRGCDFEMLLLRPAAGIASLEGKLESALTQCAKLSQVAVEASIPRFQQRSRPDTSALLMKLGLERSFRYRKADFSGIDGTREFFIGTVIHEAFIRVDEEGTEASAATAVVSMRGGPPARPVPFILDRPFLFLIREQRCGAILFIGRCMEPTTTA